ncbi:hypothetical protein CAPTEDRAFT_226533 [Capitella teleta]|uniref:Uncharacterized protein n=1 Tax=Capitella teleta TaxID=283909 RepID=R7TRC2_CAPTE|nr:hypothetical protein CAPTEDRAFT_226533 [Capitella teleta]|eukprot:ELT96194.1 hypothetical protein CAPTEDRAFT_226533 [Capitella teleta]
MGERKAVLLLLIVACVATAGAYNLRRSQDERACVNIGTELVTFVDFIANANEYFDLKNYLRILTGIDFNADVDDIQDILCSFAELSTNDFVEYLRQSGVEYNLVRGAYIFTAVSTLNSVRRTGDMPFSTTLYQAGFTLIDPETFKELGGSRMPSLESDANEEGRSQYQRNYVRHIIRLLRAFESAGFIE